MNKEFKVDSYSSKATPINCKEYYNSEREFYKSYIHDNDLEGKYYLAVIQIGEEQESSSYIKGKQKDFEYIGCEVKIFNIITSEKLFLQKIFKLIEELNDDNTCAGIMLEIDRKIINNCKRTKQFNIIQGIYNYINPNVDIDGLNSNSNFISCTAEGVIALLEDYLGMDLQGQVITVIGRSKLVGKPIVDLLIQKGATVLNANSHTLRNTLISLCNMSSIVVTATGQPNLIDYNLVHSYQTIIDVGTTYKDGKLVGDVKPEVWTDKEFFYDSVKYTPVPGGMGLVTRIIALKHFISGIKYRESQKNLKKIKLPIKFKNGKFIIASEEDEEEKEN